MGEDVMLASDYSTGVLSKDIPTEFERIRLLQDWIDPETREVISKIGVDPAWHCLEIGAGAGSVASWLADQCGQGSVTAIDIDTRYLDDVDRPNLRVLRGDIGAQDFEPGSFDLVHARLTFCHLPNRDEVLSKAVRWLRPGGWLVIGDLFSLPEEFSTYELRRRFLGAMAKLWRAQGTDMAWASTMPSRMAEAGLRSVGTRALANSVGDGSAYGRFSVVNTRQHCAYLVERGLLTSEEMEELLAQLDDPTFLELRSIMIYAWGQHP
jgi:ubiquinone/menaquinone biosynthesis C-methylase UbiE